MHRQRQRQTKIASKEIDDAFDALDEILLMSTRTHPFMLLHLHFFFFFIQVRHTWTWN